MTNRAQIFSAVCGPVGALLLFAGLFGAHFIPPTSPSTNIDDVVSLYRERTTGVSLWGISMLFLLTALMTQYAGLWDLLKRIQSTHASTRSRLQATLGCTTLLR